MRPVIALAAGAIAAAHGAALAAPAPFTLDRGTSLGLYTSLQLDGERAFVSYYDEINGDLKLASCTTGCLGSAAAWQVSTLDSAGFVGRYTSLQLNGGNPVIAYNDVTNGSLKLATCVADCTSPNAAWVLSVIDHASPDTGRFPSLQIADGNPVVSYRDRTAGALKLGTCTANCASASPTWIVTTVDAGGEIGRFDAMQLVDGQPVIAYFDATHGTMKLAWCTAGCRSASPSWAIDAFDTVPNDAEMQVSLAIIGGKPVVSYHDAPGAKLKLATCTAGCATSTRTWILATVDAAGDAGAYSSLASRDDRPVIAYLGSMTNCTVNAARGSCHTATDLRFAVCTADCATASPTWTVTTIDNSGLAGWDPSLRVAGGTAVVSYHDQINGSVKLAALDIAEAARPVNYTALWWQFDESGWGVNFSHQGDTVFATLFVYDTDGQPLWLVMSDGRRQASGAFSGPLYRTTGPAFNATPFTPIGPANLTQVGTMSVTFAGDTASLNYAVNGAKINKTVRRQVFGARAAACHPTMQDRSGLANYEDLWWNPAESGWGMNLTHQGDVIFATLFTYDASGRGTWLVMPDGQRAADGGYAGALYRTRGPAFNAVPFTPITVADLTRMGTLQLRFADGTHGTLTYSVDGVSVTKAIERQVFSSPAAACE